MVKPIKIIVTGASNTGKTSLINYYINRRTITYNNVSTIGVDFYTKYIDNLKLHILDTCGLEYFRSITSAYYHNASVVILCFSLSNKLSFENLNIFYQEIYNMCNKNVYIVLVGTHADNYYRDVTSYNVESSIINTNIPFFEVSSKDGYGIDALFTHIIDYLVANKDKYVIDDQPLDTPNVSINSINDNSCCVIL